MLNYPDVASDKQKCGDEPCFQLRCTLLVGWCNSSVRYVLVHVGVLLVLHSSSPCNSGVLVLFHVRPFASVSGSCVLNVTELS